MPNPIRLQRRLLLRPLIAGLLVLCATATITTAEEVTYGDFLAEVKADLAKQNIPTSLLDDALGANPQPDPEVIRRLNKQPESTFSFEKYYNHMVSDYRVKNGRAKLAAHRDMLNETADKYGVPPEVILALWGVESAYGKLPGDFKIIPSLATLAYKSHRRDFFRKELIHALRIVNQGHIPLKDMTGSWAGAMGQPQFMPSSFFTFAADGNADGRKDIWTTEADVFASAANYLSRSGWDTDATWGQRVVLSKVLPDIDFSQRGLSEALPVAQWVDHGVQTTTRKKPLDPSRTGRLFLPEGPSGKAYLVYDNFDVILKWNRSSFFAFSVLSLADAIAGREPA